MRAAARRVAAVLAVLVWLVAGAAPVLAMSPLRLQIAADVLGEMRRQAEAPPFVAGGDPAFAMIAPIFRRHGVDVFATGAELDCRDSRGVAGAAGLIADTAAPAPAGPAPGDLVRYLAVAAAPVPAGGAPPSLLSTGVFVSAEYVVIAGARTGSLEIHRLADLTPAGGSIAQPGSVNAFRLPARCWPGGRDDRAIAAGSVALTDPGRVAADLAWSAAHPRDARPSLAVEALRAVIGIAVLAAGVLTAALAAGMALARHLFPMLFALLGATFDGRGLHRGLTVAVLVIAGLGLLAWAPPLLAVVAALAVAGRCDVPVAGGVARGVWRGVWNVASFVVSVAGVDDRADDSVLAAVAGVLTFPMLWLKPVLAATRISALSRLAGAAAVARRLDTAAAWADALRATAVGGHQRLLRAVSDAGGALSLRPLALRDAVLWMRTRGAVAGAGGGELTRVAVLRSLRWRALDITSLLWRPGHVGGDALEHLSDGMAALARRLDGGGLRIGATWLPRRAAAWLQHAATATISWSGRTLTPMLERLVDAGRFSGAASTLTATAHGAPLQMTLPAPAALPAAAAPAAVPPPSPRPQPPPLPGPPPALRRAPVSNAPSLAPGALIPPGTSSPRFRTVREMSLRQS